MVVFPQNRRESNEPQLLPFQTGRSMKTSSVIVRLVCCAGLVVAAGYRLAGQQGPPPQPPIDMSKVPAGAPAPKTWTAQEDHQNMMEQLGIKALRPGPSGNEQAPNHANYDEATANPFPNLPDVLTLKNGKKVTTAAQWWTCAARRSSKTSIAKCSAACQRTFRRSHGR